MYYGFFFLEREVSWDLSSLYQYLEKFSLFFFFNVSLLGMVTVFPSVTLCFTLLFSSAELLILESYLYSEY